MKIKTTIGFFCVSLLLCFQNCAVYKSEGRRVFESNLQDFETKGCYPFIDTNLAMQYMNSVSDIEIFKSYPPNENAIQCDFYANNILKHIDCKVSAGNAEHILLIKQGDTSFIEGYESSWTASASAGFSGTNYGGYTTLDLDGSNTIRFIALDGNELRGVACSLRLTPSEYSSNQANVQSALSKMAFEMAINNQN